MNFFGLQDTARRNSLILLGVFSAAMLVFGWFISKLALVFAKLLSFGYPSIEPQWVQISIVSLTWGYILYKCYERHRDINYGGGVLAEVFGAEQLDDSTATGKERELTHIVAEMAVASSENPLPCFVLRNEPGINAFVLGKQDNPALVVTQGVINELDRDETSAVVAHEYAHIANQDLKLNMRMLVALGGLNAINELGESLLDGASDNTHRESSALSMLGDNHSGGFIIAFVAGIFLCFLGFILVLFGDIIKAGFSRKRELLADAKAVQYTRDTWGLASVLDTSSNDPKKPSLDSVYAGELEHLCIKGPWKHKLFSGWLANHPAPDARISLIEPHFLVKKRSRARRDSEEETGKNNSKRSQGSMSVGAAGMALPVETFEKELSVVLSVMVGMAGYNDEKTRVNFNNAMRCYTHNEYPLLLKSEKGTRQKLDQALDQLQNQSPAQKQALVDHLQELMLHDGISAPEEESLLAYISERLVPGDKAA